ncbi:MAG TPA: F0F1 ATP synthase subunit A [Thermoanaerobaculia bacterium]|nr:F0F1 ATP synthase subunit A [Thermoanaerobaculia bacterium]
MKPALSSLLLAADPLDHVSQHRLVTRAADWGFLTPDGQLTLFSDLIAMMVLGALLLMVFLPAMVRKRRGTGEVDRLVPAGPANFIEAICEYLRRQVARPLLHEHTDRFIPFIWSVFFFILIVNVLGLLPFGATSALFGTHIGGTATANIWVTGALALVTLGMMIVNGIRLGGTHYFAHFNPVPSDLPFAIRLFLVPLMIVVEIFGLLAKIFALAVRLFANMTAGHILLAVLLGFILSAGSLHWAAGLGVAVPVVAGSVAIFMLEIFVAFLQAFIFTFLTTLFLGQSVVFHHHDEHGHAQLDIH